MTSTDPLYEHERRMAQALIGEQGLALAAGAGEFLKDFVDGIPVGYALRLQVERTGDRDEVTLTIGSTSGEVDFLLVWRETGLELVPISRPYVF